LDDMKKPIVAILDPVFEDRPDLEQAVWGDTVETRVWRPTPRPGEQVPAAFIADADVVMNGRSRHAIDAATVAAMTKARLVVQIGVGFNHIDVAACAARGIAVCNTPDYGTREVADHAIALVLTLARGTAAFDTRLKERPEAWSTRDLDLPPIRRLKGLVFGVVGLGRIGLAAANRAKSFEFDVAFHDPYLAPGTEFAVGFRRHRTLAGLLAESDVVSIHCPMTRETTGLFDDTAVAALKPGAILVNTARGGITDLDAIERGLRSGRIGAAGLDVLPQEPPDQAHPLIKAWRAKEPWLEGRLVITPHAAFFTPESLVDMRRLAALTVHEFLTEGTLRAPVMVDTTRHR
jgi:lactate dehydrogenase-like 2-hydroxyacid dehydrogenase